MHNTKLHYVFSFIFVLILNLNHSGFAQEKSSIQKGTATWYGAKYHGKKTSNGEVYNKSRMTAAHPTLPFGTKVKVTNAKTNQSVIVRINDRGPFGKKGCIIDLSEAAARKIKLFNHGYGKVIVQILPNAIAQKTVEKLKPLVTLTLPTDFSKPLQPQQVFVIQAGSFSDMTNANFKSKN